MFSLVSREGRKSWSLLNKLQGLAIGISNREEFGLKRCPVARVYGVSHSNSQEQMKKGGGVEEEEEAAVIRVDPYELIREGHQSMSS